MSLVKQILAALKSALTIKSAVENAFWGLIYSAVAIVIPIVFHVVTGLDRPYLILLGLVSFLAAVTATLVYRARNATGELDAVIEEEQWENFKYRALLWEARVTVTNKTARRKQLIAFEMQGPIFAQGLADATIRDEVRAREQRQPLLRAHAFVEPGEQVSGWVIHAFKPNGKPDFTLSVRDEFNHEYVARRR